jgi:hypothetical protein
MIMEAPTAIPGVLATTVRVVAGFCSAMLMVSVGVVVEVTAGNISGLYFFRADSIHKVYKSGLSISADFVEADKSIDDRRALYIKN